MIEVKNIEWYLEDPERLLYKKPFTRGGTLRTPMKGSVEKNEKTKVELSSLVLNEISQDVYLQEYDPSLHRIRYNQSIPKIAVRVGGQEVVIDELVLTSAFQKNIHSAHTLHLAATPMDFTLCNLDKNEEISLTFQEYKQNWLLRNMESIKYDAISKQKKVGDMAALFMFDKKKGKGKVRILSYDEGYIPIPNYNEFGEEISRSIYYKVDDFTEVIDTYDDTYLYRNIKAKDGEMTENGWVRTKILHGFSRNPLLFKRGNVAWEYAESIIEIWELLANIHAVTLKRFGTWGLVLKGDMDEDSFKRDSNTLIINLTGEESQNMDAKTLEFPEPKSMIEYLEFLFDQITIAASVTLITPKDLKVGGDIGGNAVQFAMKNDLALATQSISDWSEFTDDMAFLFGEMLDLENGNQKYANLQIKARLTVWTPESKNTLISNIVQQSKFLSAQTIAEKLPDAAPDELERKKKEQAETDAHTLEMAEKNAQIAQKTTVEEIETTTI